MLFDLSNPRRKNVIRVVYAVLALLFVVGFVGFGIGGELGGGGIVDSLSGGGGGSTAGQYEQQIEDAEETLEADPTNREALAELALYRAQSGFAQLEFDEQTGQPTALTEDSRDEFEAAIEAWNRYLDTEPRRPDVAAATQVKQAYTLLGDFGGAAEAQAVFAKQNANANSFYELAYYHYADFDFEAGDKAAERALEEAGGNERKQTERQLDQLRKAAKREEERLASATDAGGEGSAVQSPFGGLDPSGGAVPPTAP